MMRLCRSGPEGHAKAEVQRLPKGGLLQSLPVSRSLSLTHLIEFHTDHDLPRTQGGPRGDGDNVRGGSP
jgi:hypothetical protein